MPPSPNNPRCTQDVLVVLRDIQGSINSLGSNGGSRLTNSASSGSAGPRAIPARASAVGKLRCALSVMLRHLFPRVACVGALCAYMNRLGCLHTKKYMCRALVFDAPTSMVASLSCSHSMYSWYGIEHSYYQYKYISHRYSDWPLYLKLSHTCSRARRSDICYYMSAFFCSGRLSF